LNNNYKDIFYLLLGVIGAAITLFGFLHTPAQTYYVIGSGLLLLTSINFKLFYFMALEVILLSGHGAILLGISTVLQLALPILLCVQLLVFYLLSGRLNNIFLLIGIAGIAVISIGFSYENQWVFFIGSASVAVYAFYIARRNRVSLLWAVLNVLFALIAITKITLPLL
jgi:hypothetical protein